MKSSTFWRYVNEGVADDISMLSKGVNILLARNATHAASCIYLPVAAAQR